MVWSRGVTLAGGGGGCGGGGVVPRREASRRLGRPLAVCVLYSNSDSFSLLLLFFFFFLELKKNLFIIENIKHFEHRENKKKTP